MLQKPKKKSQEGASSRERFLCPGRSVHAQLEAPLLHPSLALQIIDSNVVLFELSDVQHVVIHALTASHATRFLSLTEQLRAIAAKGRCSSISFSLSVVDHRVSCTLLPTTCEVKE
eukprot:121739-Amphidinium_carterae.1